jgi:hypothetical protein
VAAAGPFRSAAFQNSCMGALAGPSTCQRMQCMQPPAVFLHALLLDVLVTANACQCAMQQQQRLACSTVG